MGGALLSDAERERVQRHLFQFCKSHEDAEDATQEALYRLHRDGIQSRSMIAHVLVIGRRILIDLARKRQRWRQEPLFDIAHDHTPESLHMHRRRADALRRAMDALPDVERRCMIGRAEGLTLREIGEREGMDLRRVAERVVSATAKLKRALSESA